MPVALLTGASRGLGFALASSLAADGWSLVIDARSAPELDAAADAVLQLSSPPATIVAISGDVGDAAHRTDLVDAAARLGPIDAVVNNASVLGPSPQPELAAYPLDVLDAVYRVNVLAPLGLVQAALPRLRPGAVIVNITSDA